MQLFEFGAEIVDLTFRTAHTHTNNQIITGWRQSNFEVLKTNNYKLGNNILVNRLSIKKKKISLEWLNQSFPNFKYL